MFEETVKLIEKQLGDNWSATPIQFDGVEFTPVVGTPFIRLQIEWVDAQTISIGGLDRGTGYIMASVFTPINLGAAPANAYADQIATIFNKWFSGNLTFYTARTVRVGQQQEWYQVNVLIDFKYDEC